MRDLTLCDEPREEPSDGLVAGGSGGRFAGFEDGDDLAFEVGPVNIPDVMGQAPLGEIGVELAHRLGIGAACLGGIAPRREGSVEALIGVVQG